METIISSFEAGSVPALVVCVVRTAPLQPSRRRPTPRPPPLCGRWTETRRAEVVFPKRHSQSSGACRSLLGRGCPVHCGMFASILGLYPLDTSSPPPQVVTTKSSPATARRSPGGPRRHHPFPPPPAPEGRHQWSRDLGRETRDRRKSWALRPGNSRLFQRDGEARTRSDTPVINSPAIPVRTEEGPRKSLGCLGRRGHLPEPACLQIRSFSRRRTGERHCYVSL